MAFSMLSLGMDSALAFSMALASEMFMAGSVPPSRAATVIARDSLQNSLPRLASVLPFLCLMVAHLECPDTRHHLPFQRWPAAAAARPGSPASQSAVAPSGASAAASRRRIMWMNSSCRRVSSVSSGWNAVTSTSPSRAATM